MDRPALPAYQGRHAGYWATRCSAKCCGSPSKDELVAEYLRRFAPSVLSGVFDRTDLTPRERLLAAFDVPPTTPLCPYIGAAVELHDPGHPASRYAREYKEAVAARLADTAREAGAADPEQLGEQLALLIDGAAARTRVLDADAFPTAAAIAAVLIDTLPATAGDDRRRPATGRSTKLTRHSETGPDALSVARLHPPGGTARPGARPARRTELAADSSGRTATTSRQTAPRWCPTSAPVTVHAELQWTQHAHTRPE